MTRRAMDFIREQGDQPWVLHLSYIKPHWPYVAPAPYHQMYGAAEVLPVQRHPTERENASPVLRGFQSYGPSQSFQSDEVRETVIPTYMGLISQIDDQIGVLMDFMRTSGRDKDTMIVFTSDHGDYLGDHWLGEKELFHDCITRVPLIVVDPRASADNTRGTVCADLVEAIDLVPTFLDALDLPQPREWLEGTSLLPIVEGLPGAKGRDRVYCENTFAFRDQVRLPVGASVDHCNMVMVRDQLWKFVYIDGLPPLLYDLQNDPQEFHDLGHSPAHAAVREEMQHHLLAWLISRKQVTGLSYSAIEAWNRKEIDVGIEIGAW
jgi:arylsulfatase A-like enzyme